MTPATRRVAPFFLYTLLILWLLQVAWLVWRFAPEAAELWPRLWQVSARAQHGDPLETWLPAIAQVIPPEDTYILIDCYETGQYAKMRYRLYPRRQIRLEPKATPTLLYTMIRQEKARFLVVGGCNQAEHWHFLWQREPQVFRPVPISGPGLIFQVDPTQLIGGFYD
jgi:hypothetical protein